MRDIKFKVWDNEKKCFVPEGEIIFAFYGDTNITVVPNSLEYIGDRCHNGEPQRGRFIIMQFTGLHDNNGKEIYEGDIVKVYECECVGHSNDGDEKWEECVGEVSFEDGMFVFNGHSAGKLPMYAYEEHLEVIGNIYENPELLSYDQRQ